MVDYNSERQKKAQSAFGDPKLSVLLHGNMMETFNVDIRKNSAMCNRALVLAGMAGVCSAAHCLAFAHGASELAEKLLVSGSAPFSRMVLGSVLGGLSLAFVTTTSFKSEREIYDLELLRELWEIENHLSGELQEMIAIYKSQGLTPEEALVVTQIFSRRKRLFANLMMVEELGYSRLEPPTLREAVTNAAMPVMLGYAGGLMIPLLPLFLDIILKDRRGRSSPSLIADAIAKLHGSSFISRNLNFVGAGMLVISSVSMGVLHTAVFFGAYATTKLRMKMIAIDLMAVGVVYSLGFLTAKYL